MENNDLNSVLGIGEKAASREDYNTPLKAPGTEIPDGSALGLKTVGQAHITFGWIIGIICGIGAIVVYDEVGYFRLFLVVIALVSVITGYMRGGCSPIGMKKPYPVYADNSLLQQDQVLVNAGKRGLQLQLAPRDLVAYCRITLGDLLH